MRSGKNNNTYFDIIFIRTSSSLLFTSINYNTHIGQAVGAVLYFQRCRFRTSSNTVTRMGGVIANHFHLCPTYLYFTRGDYNKTIITSRWHRKLAAMSCFTTRNSGVAYYTHKLWHDQERLVTCRKFQFLFSCTTFS